MPRDFNVLEITTILARIAEINFYCGRDSWSLDLKMAHQNLSVKLHVMSEEVFGLGFCTISLHNSINIHEDTLNFSPKDSFWCGAFERAVKKHIGRPRNKTELEKTFVQSEEQRELPMSKAIRGNNN